MSVIKPPATISATQDFVQQSDKPAAPSSGQTKVYSKTDGNLYLQNNDGIEIPVGAGTTVDLVTQASHGFTASDVGTPLYLNGATYTPAKADAGTTAEVVGLLSRYIDANKFEVTVAGEVTVSSTGIFDEAALPAVGAVLYLSATNAGNLTVTEPSTVGFINKPIGIVSRNSAGSVDIYFYNMRGTTVGGANVYTNITLPNAATTTLQNVSSHTAGSGGFIEGFIKLDTSGTDYVFTFKTQFSKTIAGGYDSTTTYGAGDVPSGFSISITSGGLIQATVPSISVTSGVATFAMQSAANGTQLPINIPVTQLSLNTSGTAPAAGVLGEKITFTERTIAAVTSGYTANSSALATLTPGVWLLYGWMFTSAAASLTRSEAFIASNFSNDSTGALNENTFPVASASVGTGHPMSPGLVVTASNLPVYAKAQTTGANTSVSVRGFAIRIG